MVPYLQIFAPGAALRYEDFRLSESLIKPLVMAKLNIAYDRAKPSKTAVVLIVTISSVPPAHHRTIWCRRTFGPRSPGLNNPTSLLRPALPEAPTTEHNAM